MPLQRLAPDALLVQTNLSGALSAILEDPDTGDTNWLTAPALQSAAAKTYYLLDTTAGAGYALQENGTAPAPNYFHNAGSASGWNPGNSTPVPRYANLDYNTEVARNAFATTEPTGAIVTTANAGNFFRTPSPLTGSFAAGNWTFNLAVRSHTTANSADFLIKYRVWRTTDATGATGATQVTSGVISSNTVTATMSLTADTATTATWTAPAFSLADEYLFITCYIHVTAVGAATGHDVNLRKGSTSNIATTAFTPSEPDTAASVSFPTPSNVLTSGAGGQEFRALVRKKGAGTNPDATLSLYEAGSLVSTLAGPTAVSSSAGTVISGTWDASGRTMADIEALVSGAGAVGGSLEVGAIEWNATIDEMTISAGALPATEIQYGSQVYTPLTDTDVHVSFADPPQPLAPGAGYQHFRVLVRKSGGVADPSCTLKLFEGGVQRGSPLLGPTPVSSAVILDATWNATLLSNTSGADVELKIVGTGGAGSSLEVGAVEWNAVMLPPPAIGGGVIASGSRVIGTQVGGDPQNVSAGLISNPRPHYGAAVSAPYIQASFIGALTAGPYVAGSYPPPKDPNAVYGATLTLGEAAQVISGGFLASAERSQGAQVDVLFTVGNDLSLAWNVAGVNVSYRRLAPDALVATEHLAGSLAAIQEDPDSSDANWLTAT